MTPSAHRKTNRVAMDPDAAAAEKHQLRLIQIIIIIILRYSKDVQLPFQAEQEESSDELLLWYSEAQRDWSPA